MAATSDQIAKVRLLSNLEASDSTYTDAVLADLIESYPLEDERGEQWYYYGPQVAGSPPTKLDNPAWIPTYDLNLATADVWEAKAATLADSAFDFSAEQGSFSRSQMYDHARNRAAYFRSRRSVRAIRMLPTPVQTSRLYLTGE